MFQTATIEDIAALERLAKSMGVSVLAIRPGDHGGIGIETDSGIKHYANREAAADALRQMAD